MLLFSLGFSFVFIIFGATASVLGKLLLQNSNQLRIIAGLIIIIFSLQLLGVINIKFLNLVRIEALTCYKKQPVTGHAIISAPIFEPLTDELINSGRSYMCRLVRYSNKSLNISLSEDMELPIYHQYFFLVGNNTSIAPSLATLADIDSISFDELTEERTTRESELECSPEYAGTVEET